MSYEYQYIYNKNRYLQLNELVGGATLAIPIFIKAAKDVAKDIANDPKKQKELKKAATAIFSFIKSNKSENKKN